MSAAGLGPGEQAAPEKATWYAYLEMVHTTSWFNHQTYVDTLQPDALRRFWEITHERYTSVVGEYFGSTIPANFVIALFPFTQVVSTKYLFNNV